MNRLGKLCAAMLALLAVAHIPNLAGAATAGEAYAAGRDFGPITAADRKSVV